MKLKEYIEQLNEIIKENPKYENLDVLFAKDDEGNEFGFIGFAPSLGNISDDMDFTQVENFEDIDEEDRIVNAICVN